MARTRSLVRRITFTFLLALTLAAGLLAGCTPEVVPVEVPPELARTGWTLVLLQGEGPAPGSFVSLRFISTRFKGFAGCNAYTGSLYKVGNNRWVLSRLDGGSNKCADTAIVDQEARFFQAFRSAFSYRLEADRLNLLDREGALLMVFQRAAPLESNLLPLDGTDWIATDLHRLAPIPATEPRLSIAGDQLTGFTGCRHFTARLAEDDEGLHIRDLATAELACFRSQAFRVEDDRFLTLLGRAEAFQAGPDALAFFTDRGEVVRLAPAPGPLSAGQTLWKLTGIRQRRDEVQLVPGAAVVMAFREGAAGKTGLVSGFSGCNEYAMSFQFNGTFFRFGMPVVTDNICAYPAGIAWQENQYLTTLREATSYRLDGNHLELETPASHVLLFDAYTER